MKSLILKDNLEIMNERGIGSSGLGAAARKYVEDDLKSLYKARSSTRAFLKPHPQWTN